ncbi:MAG: hypothetical protein M0O93_06735 [Bacteroidales bacterium]|nr:hypothetical protein [Bacteroidales bacterium]
MLKNKKFKTVLIKILEFFAVLLVVYTIINIDSIDSFGYNLIYILSIISLVFAFIISLTQGLLKTYTKQVILGIVFILFVSVFNQYICKSISCQRSLTPLIVIIASTVSLLTFYGIESDRKKREEQEVKEKDERPFIISKPSDFEIKEEDFPEEESTEKESDK